MIKPSLLKNNSDNILFISVVHTFPTGINLKCNDMTGV